MAAAETGSGKTGAFALPVLQIVHETLIAKQRGKLSSGAAGSGEGVVCCLNLEDRDPLFAVTPNGLRCQARSEQAWAGGRGTIGAFSGRVYYEARVEDEGLCR